MKLVTLALTAAALITAPAIASAQGNSNNSPGHQMQEKGSVPGSPGASGYAPGHTKGTTGMGDRDRDDMKRGGMRDRDDVKDRDDRTPDMNRMKAHPDK